MNRLRFKFAAPGALLLASLALPLASCSLMHDDLPECPQGVDLQFVYDYNIQRADMFPYHVGSVTAHVFDADGHLVKSVECHNSEALSPLADHAYRMRIELEPGEYTVIAEAHESDEESRLASGGALFRNAGLLPGDHLSGHKITLDRSAGVVMHGDKPLDALWHSMSATPVTVTAGEVTPHTLSLVRNTNEITVSLHQLEDRADMSHDDYEVRIVAENGLMDYDNTVLPDELLTYTPYQSWTTEFSADQPDEGSRKAPVHASASARRSGDHRSTGTDGASIADERTAHFALSTSRLIHHSDTQSAVDPARLQIVNKESGQVVADINLCDMLANGRGACDRAYTPQEFLDREYRYSLDFFLQNGKWKYVNLSISILNWSKRIQNETL